MGGYAAAAARLAGYFRRHSRHYAGWLLARCWLAAVDKRRYAITRLRYGGYYYGHYAAADDATLPMPLH